MIDASILAQDLVSNSYYTTAKSWKDKLVASFEKGKEPGEPCHLTPLKSVLPVRLGFMYVFTGWPGSGKTELLNQLSILQAKHKGRKVALYSPEGYPVDDFIDSLIHTYTGKTTDKRYPNVCTMDEYIKAIDWVDKYFYFLDWKDTPDAETLLSAFEFLNKTKGVEICIVDPFNSIISEGEDRNIAVALKKNLTGFKRFAQQKRVCMWLVEHPKTPTDYKEYEKMPGPRNLFGGTMWWNKVDVFASLHIPDRNSDFVDFKTWKIKNHHLNGKPGDAVLRFDFKTRQYYSDKLEDTRTVLDFSGPKDKPPF